MRPISFFTPVSFDYIPNKTKRQHFIQAIDAYLYLKGKKAYVLDAAMVNRSRPAIILNPHSSSKTRLAIKIVSYAIFVLPLIALAAKSFTRSIHRFHLHAHPKIPIRPVPSPRSEPLMAPISNPPPQDKCFGEHPSDLPVPPAIQVPIKINRPKKPPKPRKAVHVPVAPPVQLPKKITLPQEVRQAAEELKAKFSIPKSLLSDLRNRRPKVSDIKSMLGLGNEMDHLARALQHQLDLFKVESRTVKKAQIMLEELRDQIATASATIKNKKLTSLYDCWATSLILEGLFLGKKQAAIDSVSETIEEYVGHLDTLINHA
ncbi:MAG: DUF648 domain-containing protein [Parachlamydia sp.]|nr:DUF648 domain-containing protein [Parachlamydia sp.]